MKSEEKVVINITKNLLLEVEYNPLTTWFNGRDGILIEIKKLGLAKSISYFLEGDIDTILNLTGYNILDFIRNYPILGLLSKIIRVGKYSFSKELFVIKPSIGMRDSFRFNNEEFRIIQE